LYADLNLIHTSFKAMMKFTYQSLFTIILLSCCICFSYAQETRKNDLIIKRDSSRIEALILEVDEQIIRYKKYSDREGPTFSLSKKDIASIVYGNGEVEVFEALPEIYFDEVPAPIVTQPNKPATSRYRSGSTHALSSDQLRTNYQFFLRKNTKYKTMAFMGISAGVLCTVIGIITLDQANREYNAAYGHSTQAYENKLLGGALLVTGGIFGGVPLTVVGLINKNRYAKKATAVEHELKRRGEPVTSIRLSPGFNTANRTASLTLRLNF
jgi:hypothetical protein